MTASDRLEAHYADLWKALEGCERAFSKFEGTGSTAPLAQAVWEARQVLDKVTPSTDKELPGSSPPESVKPAAFAPILAAGTTSEARRPPVDKGLVERLIREHAHVRFGCQIDGVEDAAEAIVAALTRPLGEGKEAYHGELAQLLRESLAFVEDETPFGYRKGADLDEFRETIKRLVALRSPPPQGGETEILRALIQSRRLIAQEVTSQRRGLAIQRIDAALSIARHMPSRESLRQKILADPDLDTEAGGFPIAPDHVLVERAELEDYAHVIGNLIGELSDPGTGALTAHHRIKGLLSAAPQPPSHGQGEGRERAAKLMREVRDEYHAKLILPGGGLSPLSPGDLWAIGIDAVERALRAVPPSSGEAEAVARLRQALEDVRDYVILWGCADEDDWPAQLAKIDEALSPKADGADHG